VSAIDKQRDAQGKESRHGTALKRRPPCPQGGSPRGS
jgi:hypothetical protein